MEKAKNVVYRRQKQLVDNKFVTVYVSKIASPPRTHTSTK